jgi:Leucine-rich repeat (LRR) protein
MSSILQDDLPDVGMPPQMQSDRSLMSGSSFSRLPPIMEENDGTFFNETSVAMQVDDFSEASHAQLPNIEEYKSNVQHTKRKDRKRQLKIMLACFLSLILLAMFISLGVLLGREASQPASQNESFPSNNRQVNAFIDNIVNQGWSKISSFKTNDSPQYRAAEWLAMNDTRDLDSNNNNLDELRERYALTVFYFATGGGDQKWMYDIGWLTRHSHCQWNKPFPGAEGQNIFVGVKCGWMENVREIFLPNMGLEGTLPEEISLLPGILRLDMYKNGLSKKIPDALRNLNKLQTLVLHGNAFTGTIPEWVPELSDLRVLDLAVNDMEGGLPSNISTMPVLQTLNLERVGLSGKIDPLSGIKSLEFLALADNLLTGPITDEFLQSMPDLSDLDLSDNSLSGTLPSTLFDHKSIKVIDLHGNKFKGPLPYTQLESQVEFLSLSENQLSGPIDTRITRFSQLRHLDLSKNQFTGDIPTELGELVNLKYLFLAFNEKLTPGKVPFQLVMNLLSLQDLSLQATNRIGHIPSSIALPELVLLDLASNDLTGEIPDLWMLEKLRFLILKGNRLEGSLPDSFANLRELDTLVIDDNKLTGNANVACEIPALDMYVADCEEIGGCMCCTVCCDSGKTDCNSLDWFAPQDPVTGYQLERVSYEFNERNIVYSLPQTENMTTAYDFYDVPDEFTGGGVRHRGKI